MNKITGLEFFQTGTVFSQFLPTGNWSFFPPNLKHIDNSINPDYVTTTVLSSGFTTGLPINLEFFRWRGGAGYGNVNGLPSNLNYLDVRQCYFNGNISDLPSNLEVLRLFSNDTLSGDTSGFPTTLDFIDLGGSQNTISGNVSNLPKIFTNTYTGPFFTPRISIGGFNTISGDTSGFSGSYPELLSFGGLNTISGSLSGIPNTVTGLFLGGNNTISGCLSELTLTGSPISITIGGLNTLSCDGSGLPSGITNLSLFGNNMVISGDISTYSGTTTPTRMDLFGLNTISGDISGIWSGTNILILVGNNTVTGDIANLPNTSPPTTREFNIGGQNTIYGDIADLPSTYTDFRCGGFNTISGDVADIPSQVSYLDISGNNTIGGVISGLSSTTLQNLFLVSPATTLTGPVAGISIPNYRGFIYRPLFPATGLTSTDIDDLLCYFTGLTMNSSKFITIDGTNAAPSPTGMACKAILTGNSVTVLTN
jgi:hypothetical protein